MRTLYLVSKRLPRVCMGGSLEDLAAELGVTSAPRVHGWFLPDRRHQLRGCVCPACAWVVPSRTIIRAVSRLSFDIRPSPPFPL